MAHSVHPERNIHDESLVTSQKEQLLRYETRLKDVVTAYKGLLKEKEALEASLSALTSAKDKTDNKEHARQSETTIQNDHQNKSADNNLQLQIATLMNSLATLSAEKSRIEASFQADKKQLRSDIAQKDKTILELQENIKTIKKQNAIELEKVKSKLIVEKHEREKESNNHMIMIRELQKLFADERYVKENLEMQLNDLKSQFSPINNSGKVKELMHEIKEAKEKLSQYETVKETQSNQSNSTILLQLQNEMQHLKHQHAIALKTEQKRALMAEERNKKLAALHENRVANLEARLAELSSTVGTYDKLRQQDQQNIQKLKETIIRLGSADSSHHNTNKDEEKSSDVDRDGNKKDVETIVQEIIQLKKLLLIENAKSRNPVDINTIFNISTDHSHCLEDFNKIQNDLETFKLENIDLKQALDVQKNHIKTLQEKVKVLNRNIDEQELELKAQTEKLNHAVKTEKSKYKAALNRIENEYRCKLNNLELELQKQRVRSLQLLDEKENEIKTLKTSSEIFMPASTHSIEQSLEAGSNEEQRNKNHRILSSTNTTTAGVSSTNNSGGVGNNFIATAMGEHSPMLHYINELARKDVEISSLRKAKYAAETTLRQALQDKVTSQEELNDKILRLEEEVDRLERCKTREGANLEYLKNVIISFFSTNNVEGKHHMVNAIGAVLQFTPAEMKAINNLYPKK